MAAKETNFKLGYFRGKLRYRSVSRWSKDLEVSMQAINNHIEKGRSFQGLIDEHHDNDAWVLWQEFCYAT